MKLSMQDKKGLCKVLGLQLDPLPSNEILCQEVSKWTGRKIPVKRNRSRYLMDFLSGYGCSRVSGAEAGGGHTCHVYFIQAGEGGPIKIGVAKDVEKRLKGLQTASPKTLVLLASIPVRGSIKAYAMERDFHFRLSGYRIRGEWFSKKAIPAISRMMSA